MQYYTPEEKEIFINTFLKQSEGSKKVFNNYILDFYKTNDLLAPGVTKFTENKPCNQFLKPDAVFDTHQKMWDKKDNLVTYMLSQSEFRLNSKNLHRLNFVHPDWKYKNKDGMNAVLLIAKRGNFKLMKKVAEDFDLNINSKDEQGNYFTRMVFKPDFFYQGQDINFDLFVRVMTKFQEVDKVMSEYPQHFDLSFNKIKSISDEWKKNLELVRELYQKNTDPMMSNKALDIIVESWDKVDKRLETILLVKKLDKELDIAPDSKRMKI